MSCADVDSTPHESNNEGENHTERDHSSLVKETMEQSNKNEFDRGDEGPVYDDEVRKEPSDQPLYTDIGNSNLQSVEATEDQTHTEGKRNKESEEENVQSSGTNDTKNHTSPQTAERSFSRSSIQSDTNTDNRSEPVEQSVAEDRCESSRHDVSNMVEQPTIYQDSVDKYSDKDEGCIGEPSMKQSLLQNTDIEDGNQNVLEKKEVNVVEIHYVAEKKTNVKGSSISDIHEITNDVSDTDKVKGTLSLLKDLIDDVTTKTQPGTPERKSQAVEQEECESIDASRALAESVDEAYRVTDVSEQCESHCDKVQSNPKLNHGEVDRKINELSREKENSPRNVFDAFHINQSPHEKSSDESSSTQLSGKGNENICSVDADTQKTKEGETDASLTLGAIDSQKTSNSVPEFHDSFGMEILKEKQRVEGKHLDAENDREMEEMDDTDRGKTVEKSGAKSNKELKHFSVAQEKDSLQESDILKKAKEKYNLKELRVSLNTDEVKDCGEVTSLSVQCEKSSNFKVPKLKQTNENCAREKTKKDGKEKNSYEEKVQVRNDCVELERNHSKFVDNQQDSDSAKPLKKRGRRGYEDTKGSDKAENSQACDLLELQDKHDPDKQIHENDHDVIQFNQIVAGQSSGMEEAISDKFVGKDTSKQTREAEPVRIRKKKDRKIKKGKRKNQDSIKLTQSFKEMEGNDSVKNPGTVISDSFDSEKIEPSDTTSLQPTDIPHVSQLKKYPGRSCKLRNQLPLVQFRQKKPKTSVKSKSCDQSKESKLKSNGADSPLKVKKKRKRKVKPWSWGNEKKKYKPKPKTVIGKGIENYSENKDLTEDSHIDSESCAKENSEDNKGIAAASHCEGKSDSNIPILDSISKEKKDCSEKLCVKPESSNDTQTNSSSFESAYHEETKVCRNSTARPKKKGRRGRKPKSASADESKCINESTGSTYLHENRASGLRDHSKEDCNVHSSNFISLHFETEKNSNGSVIQSKETSEISVNVNSVDKPTPELLQCVSDNHQVNSDTSTQNINLNDPKQKIQKRKRGRPKKGEGKEKSKKRKTEPKKCKSVVSTQIVCEEKAGQAAPAGSEPNEVQAEIDDVNVVEHVDNEIPVDNYPHVSPDSGIQSLAGSPAGNESPNSVIMNVENSSNSASVSDNKQESDTGSNDKESVAACDVLGSNPDSVPDSSSESKDKAVSLNCISEPSLNDLAVGTSSVESDSEKNIKDQTSKNNITDNNSREPREVTTNSPSKKKNRAKFLQLHKTSTLLQKGRLPTEEEKEKRLDDKFDYPEPTDDKRSSSPPIDLYSQHMKSFQVTHGICDGTENSSDKEFSGDFVKSVKKGSSKPLKKSHSKHKGKRKNSMDNSQSSIFDKMNDLQGNTESLLSSQCTHTVIVSSSSSVISDYSPVYHSSSVLTPVTSTVTTFATTGTITTYSSFVKPITSVSEIVSIPPCADEVFIIADNQKEQTSDVASDSTLNHVKTSVQEVLMENSVFETDSSIKEIKASNLLSETNSVPLKKKRGRPPNKKRGVMTVKDKILNKAKNSFSSPPPKTLNAGVEKRNRGRPKGSKNKNRKLKETVSKAIQLEKPIDLAKNRTGVSTVSEVKSLEKSKRNKVNEVNNVKTMLVNESDKAQNFSKNMMEWRESSVLGKEEKKKRGPGRPRKYPLVPKTPVKKPDRVESLKKEVEKTSSDFKGCDDSVRDNSDTCAMEEAQVSQTFEEDEFVLLDESLKQLPKIRKSKLHPMLKKGKRGKKKGIKVKKSNEQFIETVENEVIETEDISNVTDLHPARSVSSHDSDTSGAGSNFGSRSFPVQMWMEMTKQKRKKNKQKLRYFRSKHKNIIDPVFISKVDCLVDDFPQLSISPPSETYLKVRPGEVPLPSIFKIVRINIKKKKKDRLFVFEKAKPLKPKNDLESGPKDKIKVGRKIGDHLMDLSDISEHQHYNLPPKKRHKLFSGIGPDNSFPSSETNSKPEKRKAGRPKKVRPHTQEQGVSFSFGEVHKTKQGFEMGRDATETLASFASVAALSWQSPNSSFSPEKSSSSFSQISPKSKELRSQHIKSPNKPDTGGSHKSVSHGVQDSDSSYANQSTKNSSCNNCMELQESSKDHPLIDTTGNSQKKVNNQHLNRKVKRLKRKYRRSSKFTRIKRKASRPVVIADTEDSLDLDSSVRSVCSESEPLPTFHLDKRKHGSDSDDDVLLPKRLKLFKRRTSDASQESDSATVRKQAGPVNQKKKYQKAGLYSDSYKDDEKTESKETVETYFTFDLPLHFGQHQLKNINDFQLPYDIWWLHFNDMLPKKGDGKQYRRIRNNIYVDARPACRYEAHSCTCKRPSNPSDRGCGEDCINRLVYTECSPDMCPTGDQCSNQSIQKHQFASGLQKFLTKDRGFGVRTTKQIRLGQLIVEYCGEVVSEQEFRRRMTEEYSQDRNHYCLNLDGGTVIDGYRKGNIARFVNHSCEPNCEMQKWNVDGVYHMCLFALRDIEPAEELVYDYNFQSFNHDAQQLCKCGSKDCRGIIGGKKQWFNGQGKSAEKPVGKKGRLPKDKRKSKQKLDKMKEKNKKAVIPGYQPGVPATGNGHNPIPPYFSYPIKPLLKKERIFARKHTIFLVRNFDRIRGMRHREDQDTYKVTKDEADYIKGTHFTKRDVFIAQLTALKTSRSMKTRRLTVAEEDTEVGKMARIAGVCKEIYSAISAAKDEEGSFLATDLYHLPSKKKHPRYYQVIDEPIDLTMMEKKILSGTYQTVEEFEKDMIKLFQNVELYCGKKSEMGEKIRLLRAVFNNAKREGMSQLQEMLGHEGQSDVPAGALSDVDMQVATPTTSISSESDISEMSDNKGEWLQGEEEEEEIIRCICGIFKDEGLMIQCDKCYIWQHTDCMRVKGDSDHYLCEQCDPRPVNREVELVPGADYDSEAVDDGNQYFMTLMRDDMQIRLGACVYVMKENQSRRYSYKKSGGLDKDRMDIFRIERLWKNRKGDKFAFGHMYVRPHETFHEPNRKFFPNEVFRTPLYEMFHLESITGYCCVLDLLTYCKGKPKGYKDEDLYICEYRMDKTLHLFYKISAKQRCPINTRSYCFDMYEKRLNPKRTYSPHEVPESYRRNWREKSSGSSDDSMPDKKPVSDEEEDIPLVKVKIERRKEKRERVNKILDSLSRGKLSPSKKRTDLTYLLTE